ncbi:hypothetical protein [Acidaminobacter hydrogenoformans]|uniref:Uncharacterized protein n=1 Tax=Acidaminobacter hydrogenoformans DSM 2784 TaxID=1120920 RepID=A0A1G5RVJ2_9FIRM|nr:hypothetical protein [Acidaminobacter hydrogenoformans]SCZ78132.1 hypothetical protein SAMN03080599_01091 [Acidaminobacter hydrogenoformans DSM 2784]
MKKQKADYHTLKIPTALYISLIILALSLLTLTGCNRNTLSPAPPPAPEQNSGDFQGIPEALEKEIEDRNNLKERVLATYAFYKGKATIMDDSIIKGESERDELSGSGDHLFESEDVLIYDPKTRQVYLIARALYYSGEDRIIYTDLITGFSDKETMSYSGELYEVYGTGQLVKKELMDASASTQGSEGFDTSAGNTSSSSDSADGPQSPLLATSNYELLFPLNPIRMRPEDKVILTNPPTQNLYWVTLSSTRTDSAQVTSLSNQPDEVSYEVLNLIPGLPDIYTQRTYNQSLTTMAQLTNGLYGFPSGAFECEYVKITYEEAMASVEEIREAKADQETYEALAKNRVEAWQETAKLGDAMKGMADASSVLSNYPNSSDGIEYASDPNRALRDADALVTDPDVPSQLDRLDGLGGDGLQASQSSGEPESSGTPRSLENFVLETSGDPDAGTEQQRLSVSYGGALPELISVFEAYSKAAADMKVQLSLLQAMAPITADTDPAQVIPVLEAFSDARDDLTAAAAKSTSLLNALHTILSRLSLEEEPEAEVEYGQLNVLYDLWANAEAEGNASVDLDSDMALPEDYPLDVVPLPKNAAIVIYESLSEGGVSSGHSLTLKTTAAPAEISAYYTTVFADSEDIEVMNMGEMTIFSGQRGDCEVSVMVTANSLGGTEKSMVQITLIN